MKTARKENGTRLKTSENSETHKNGTPNSRKRPLNPTDDNKDKNTAGDLYVPFHPKKFRVVSNNKEASGKLAGQQTTDGQPILNNTAEAVKLAVSPCMVRLERIDCKLMEQLPIKSRKSLEKLTKNKPIARGTDTVGRRNSYPNVEPIKLRHHQRRSQPVRIDRSVIERVIASKTGNVISRNYAPRKLPPSNTGAKMTRGQLKNKTPVQQPVKVVKKSRRVRLGRSISPPRVSIQELMQRLNGGKSLEDTFKPSSQVCNLPESRTTIEGGIQATSKSNHLHLHRNKLFTRALSLSKHKKTQNKAISKVRLSESLQPSSDSSGDEMSVVWEDSVKIPVQLSNGNLITEAMAQNPVSDNDMKDISPAVVPSQDVGSNDTLSTQSNSDEDSDCSVIEIDTQDDQRDVPPIAVHRRPCSINVDDKVSEEQNSDSPDEFVRALSQSLIKKHQQLNKIKVKHTDYSSLSSGNKTVSPHPESNNNVDRVPVEPVDDSVAETIRKLKEGFAKFQQIKSKKKMGPSVTDSSCLTEKKTTSPNPKNDNNNTVTACDGNEKTIHTATTLPPFDLRKLSPSQLQLKQVGHNVDSKKTISDQKDNSSNTTTTSPCDIRRLPPSQPHVTSIDHSYSLESGKTIHKYVLKNNSNNTTVSLSCDVGTLSTSRCNLENEKPILTYVRKDNSNSKIVFSPRDPRRLSVSQRHAVRNEANIPNSKNNDDTVTTSPLQDVSLSAPEPHIQTSDSSIQNEKAFSNPKDDSDTASTTPSCDISRLSVSKPQQFNSHGLGNEPSIPSNTTTSPSHNVKRSSEPLQPSSPNLENENISHQKTNSSNTTSSPSIDVRRSSERQLQPSSPNLENENISHQTTNSSNTTSSSSIDVRRLSTSQQQSEPTSHNLGNKTTTIPKNISSNTTSLFSDVGRLSTPQLQSEPSCGEQSETKIPNSEKNNSNTSPCDVRKFPDLQPPLESQSCSSSSSGVNSTKAPKPITISKPAKSDSPQLFLQPSSSAVNSATTASKREKSQPSPKLEPQSSSSFTVNSIMAQKLTIASKPEESKPLGQPGSSCVVTTLKPTTASIPAKSKSSPVVLMEKLTEEQLKSVNPEPDSTNRSLPNDLSELLSDKWQSSKSNLTERFGFLLNTKIFSDISLIVSKAGKQRQFPAHKLVLSAGSSVFAAEFKTSAVKAVKVLDIDPDIFFELLRFLYTDDAILTIKNVVAVLNTAKKYDVLALEKICSDFVKRTLKPNNALYLLSQAKLFNEPELIKICQYVIDFNTAAVVLSEDFLTIDLETLCSLLKRDTLSCSEGILFKAILRWSKAECQRRGLPAKHRYQRLVLEDAVSLIRYPLMSAAEFSAKVASSRILPKREIIQLYLYLTANPRPPTKYDVRPRRLTDVPPFIKQESVTINLVEKCSSPTDVL